MAEITVEPVDGAYDVTVADDTSSATYRVTADATDVARLAAGAPTQDLIVASFRFLLDREPKESILQNFDLAVIGRYFPDYPSRIADYL